MLGAFLAYHALQASEDSPIGKNLDSVEADPSCYADVRRSTYRVVWCQTRENQFEGLIPNNTLTAIEKLNDGRKAITARWVF